MSVAKPLNEGRDQQTGSRVIQSSKFEVVINLQNARALGIEVPSDLPSIANEAIE